MDRCDSLYSDTDYNIIKEHQTTIVQCDEKTDRVKHTYLLDGSPKSHFYPNFLVTTITPVCTRCDEEENSLINTPRKIQSLEFLNFCFARNSQNVFTTAGIYQH